MSMIQKHRTPQRLKTTTPVSLADLTSVKAQISPALFAGLTVRKVSSNGSIHARTLTLSDDLFTLFVSHRKAGEGHVLRRLQAKGYRAYTTAARAVTGTAVRATHDLRVIDVADVLFVQSGIVGSRKLEECAEREPDLDATAALSIFYHDGRTMDLLVDDERDRTAVLDAIRTVREVYRASTTGLGREEQLLRYAWYDTDFNKSGLIDQSEFLQLLGRINIYLKEERAIHVFKCYLAAKLPRKGGMIGRTKTKQSGITFDECLRLLHKISLEVNAGKDTADVVFDELFGTETETVTAEEFLATFLHQTQRETEATLEDAQTLFAELNGGATSRGEEGPGGAGARGDAGALGRRAFREYLASARNDLYDPAAQACEPSSLTRPLSEYWINSSHNTYLTGDQLTSDSSVESYVLAMHRGCKCLELDCHDGDEGVPVVKHGYTFTSKIAFQAIISCVKYYVDAHPETLPVILSLENHCSHPFQKTMADILHDTLGESLHLPDGAGPLSSPLDLVGKVVLKGKRPPEIDDEDWLEAASSEDTDEEMTREEVRDMLKQEQGKRDKVKALMRKSSSKAAKAPLPKTHPELAKMTALNGVKHKDFATSLQLPLADMHSFAEAKLSKLYKEPATVRLWREYNVRRLSRVYPAGTRVDSSNYNPVVPWSAGCQLVALNFQTDDSPMALNDGRFRENGGCGYVRKLPSVYPTDGDADAEKTMVLRVKVLSGSCLPKPSGEPAGEVIDPYVIVRLHDVKKPTEADQDDLDEIDITEFKTDEVKDNGFCPQWREAAPFVFRVHSDVAMLEFVVMDCDTGFVDEFMCTAAVPVSRLRPGYRSLRLHDQRGSRHGPFGFARLVLDVDIAYE